MDFISIVAYLLIALGGIVMAISIIRLKAVIRQLNKKFDQEMDERGQVNKALRESEEKYRNIYENAIEGFFQSTPEGRFISVNPAFASMLGYDSPEELVSDISDIAKQYYVDPEDRHIYQEFLKKYGSVENFEFRVRRKDGSQIWVSNSTRAYFDPDGEVISYEGIVNDITKRKQAELELRESEEKYSAVIQQASEGIYLLDIDTRKILEANRSFQDLLGYNQKEISGLYIYDFLAHDKQDIDTNIHKIVSKKYYFVGERKYRHKNGTVLDFEVRANLISFSGRNVLCVVVRDITEYKQIQEEKAQLELQLQRAEKMEAIGTLAGGVAHDLNNILSGIVSYPELLLMDLPLDSPLKKPILTIQKSGEKAAAIVQDLLTLARRGVSVRETINLNHIISEYLKSHEYEKLKSLNPKTQIETLFEDNLLNIVGSPVHLTKTVMNLVSNAAEAMLKGGKITLSTKNQYIDRPIRNYDEIKEGDYIVLNLADHGIGISPKDMDRIFEPFYTKKAMGRSGTGLGMAVVWGTVKDHDGYIDVQSTEGKGTTFTLYFPVIRKDIAKDESLLTIEDYMGHGESILIVDDVEEQREIASVMLKKLGYSVTSVSSGEEAVEYMKTHSADLLVLDMIMDPGINGRETYERIIPIHSRQKAIIASGFSETDEVKKAQELGAGQYIKKPYILEKIGIAVRSELK